MKKQEYNNLKKKESKRNAICVIVFFVLMFLFAIKANAQYKHVYRSARHQKIVETCCIFTSIALNAVGDGLNDSGNKEWGHICNAASIGVTLYMPKFLNTPKDQYGRLLIKYAALRFTTFDSIYNLAAGNDIDYVGNSNYYDQALGNVKSSDKYFLKGLSLTLYIGL